MSAMSAMAAVAPAVQVRARRDRARRRLRRACNAAGVAMVVAAPDAVVRFIGERLGRRPTPRPLAHRSIPIHPLPLQARFGAAKGRTAVKARRTVVVAAVTEPVTADASDKPKPKRKFVKKNVTVQEADITVGAEFKGKVVRLASRRSANPTRPVARARNARVVAPSETPSASLPAFFRSSAPGLHRTRGHDARPGGGRV